MINMLHLLTKLSSLSIVMQHQPGGLEFAHKTDQGSVFEPAPIFPGMLTVLVGHFFDWISDRKS